MYFLPLLLLAPTDASFFTGSSKFPFVKLKNGGTLQPTPAEEDPLLTGIVRKTQAEFLSDLQTLEAEKRIEFSVAGISEIYQGHPFGLLEAPEIAPTEFLLVRRAEQLDGDSIFFANYFVSLPRVG